MQIISMLHIEKFKLSEVPFMSISRINSLSQESNMKTVMVPVTHKLCENEVLPTHLLFPQIEVEKIHYSYLLFITAQSIVKFLMGMTYSSLSLASMLS